MCAANFQANRYAARETPVEPNAQALSYRHAFDCPMTQIRGDELALHCVTVLVSDLTVYRSHPLYDIEMAGIVVPELGHTALTVELSVRESSHGTPSVVCSIGSFVCTYRSMLRSL
jgi:hypothetical protein